MLRRKSVAEDGVSGRCRKLHRAELHDLYSSLDSITVIKSRRMRWVGHMVHMGEHRNTYKVLVGRTYRKGPHGRQRHTWEDNTKIDIEKIREKNVDLIHVAQGTDQWWTVNSVMNLKFI